MIFFLAALYSADLALPREFALPVGMQWSIAPARGKSRMCEG